MIINVLEYLERTARLYPNKTAFADDKTKVTFVELTQLGKKIGSKILNENYGFIRKPIVVFVDRNVESIVSFIGVLYSGNYYVPIDSEMPQQRVNKIIDILMPSLIISTNNKTIILSEESNFKGTILSYKECIATESNEALISKTREKIIDTDPAYLIFTSGSTGTPKGVVISHKSLIDLTEWLVNTFEFSSNDILGNQTPLFFDGSVKDIYISLATGASTYIIGKKYFSFPKLLAEYLIEKKINTILWATSAMTLFGNSGILEEINFDNIRKVFFAGEAMKGKTLNTWKRNLKYAKYVNLYGPTEITVDCTYFIVDREFRDDEYIPIGFPCRNMEVMVINKNNEVVKDGEEGELCVRGTGVSLGYYNNPQKTKEVFIQNPLHNYYEDRVYRTGDIVKYNENKELVFISREDLQIKHMGNRIELGEIELAVNAIQDVTEAACIYDSAKIVLYYSAKNGKNLNIINEIKDKLPKYMFPNEVIQVDLMPYNSNGKVDRLQLKDKYKYDSR